MDKQQILGKLSHYYEDAMRDNQIYQLDNCNQELIIKLMQTTELFVRSFDYEMPAGHNFISKFKNFIRRVIRRSTRFITKPYADKMQIYNESVCELLGQMINQFGSQAANIETHDELINERKSLEDAICQIRKLEVQIELLERTVQDNKFDNDKNQIFAKQQFELSQRELQEYKAENNEVIEGIKNVLNDTVNKSLEMGGQLSVLASGINTTVDLEWNSYSQAGEDRIVNFLLNYGKEGKQLISYLDIGCNHYKKINNTYSLYEQGHRGVLVEANPHFIAELAEKRPGDVVLNVGVGNGSDTSQTFYIMNNVDMSSFDMHSITNSMKESPWLKIVEEVDIPIKRIDQIIEEYFSGTPDVVSLDIEGLEMDALCSIDFKRHRPFIFIIETISYSASIQVNQKRTDILDFMREKGYAEYAFSGINSIFIDLNKLKGENNESRD